MKIACVAQPARRFFLNIPASARLVAETNTDAETPVSGDLIEWADIIFVMEKTHRNKVAKKFKPLLAGKKLVCLDIPDNYDCMDPELIRLLEVRVAMHVRFR